MTSRREFFGLLAAAPLVAPAVVKEFTLEPTIARVALRGVRGAQIGYSSQRYVNVHNFKDWSRCAYYDHYPFRSDIPDYASAIIPNRLYGAQINADGEAV